MGKYTTIEPHTDRSGLLKVKRGLPVVARHAEMMMGAALRPVVVVGEWVERCGGLDRIGIDVGHGCDVCGLQAVDGLCEN